jgi:hypothetical protein
MMARVNLDMSPDSLLSTSKPYVLMDETILNTVARKMKVNVRM